MRKYYTPSPVEPEEKKKYYTGVIICTNHTDKLCPFSYGTVYGVKDGILKNNNGITNPVPFASLDEIKKMTGLEWREIDSYFGGEFFYTGLIYCMESHDTHVFKPGTVYPVELGQLNLPTFHTTIEVLNGDEYCKALSKEFPATFIPVLAIEEL